MAALSDPIADFLIRIKNAYRAGNEQCTAPHSKIKVEIARILKEEGYIFSYEIDESGDFPEIKVKTRIEDGKSALLDVKRVSKPGLRQYSGSEEIPHVLNGMGISIISTPKGIMTGHAAKREKIGGEVLAYVW